MRQYIKPWLEYELVQKGRQPSGVQRYRRTVEMFLDWLEGNGIALSPEKVSRADIEEFMKWLFYQKGNIRNSSRANKLAAVRSFFRYLVYRGVIKEDPTEGIPSPRVTPRLPVKFTTEELRYIFSMPDTTTEMGLRDLAMLMVLYGAGLRVSELCFLRMADVIDQGGYIRLNILGKGGRHRTITLRTNPSRVLRQWLHVRMAQGATLEDPVFVRLQGGRLERLSPQAVNNVLKKYAEKVGIRSSDAFVHKMRATFASDLYDAGRDRCPYCGRAIEKVDIFEIMHLMGHSDPKTTMRYIAISEKVLKKTAIPDRRWKELLAERRRDG